MPVILIKQGQKIFTVNEQIGIICILRKQKDGCTNWRKIVFLLPVALVLL